MSRTSLSRRLQAYHDGELSRFGRWRVERQLARDPAARRELALWGQLGDLIREVEPGPAGPDLWPAIEAAIAARGAGGHAEPGAWRRRLDGLGRGWRPVAAGLAAVTAATLLLLRTGPETDVDEVVRWLDSGGRPVMVLPADDGTTIIWVLNRPRKPDAGREAGA
jgi:anti-sigma factor RsiW